MTKTFTINLARLAAYIAAGAVVFSCIVVLRWEFQGHQKVLIVKNDPVPVRPSKVSSQEGIVYLSLDYCKTSNAKGKSNVFLVGENKGAKPAVAWPDDTTDKGCGKITVPVPIPGQTPTDVYHVVFEEDYSVNPIKSSYTTFRSRSFMVVNQSINPGGARPIPNE